MRLIIILTIFFLTACSATYKQADVSGSPQVKLDPKGKILISVPKDGSYGTINYRRSGQMTAQAIKSALARHTNQADTTINCSTTDKCLQEANRGEYSYLVMPEILHWEDRATEWSGKPDRIEVKLTIYETVSGETIHSTIISGKSKWATFGGDHPQDLLPEPINNYISSLY